VTSDAEAVRAERPAVPPPPGGSASIWARIREHKIIQWGMAYLGAAFALAQAEDLLARAFDWPDLTGRIFMVLLVVGFPVAVTVAWYHGHRGLKRISAGEFMIVSLLLLIGGIFFSVAVRPKIDRAAATRAAVSAGEVGATAAARAAPPNSIAVLPFVNISSDPEQEYFADGLSEELMNQLTKVSQLRVTARTSSFAYKGRTGDVEAIGRELGVGNVLEGSVRKSGDQVRITAQLIDTGSGFHLWSENYDRNLADVFAVQDEIARRVAGALKVTLGIGDKELRRGGTENTAAYDHYLLARSLSRQGGLRESARAMDEYGQALALDPDFGLAQIGLAQGLITLSSFSPGDFAAVRDRAIDHAVEVVPDLPETFWLLAQRHADRREWQAAEQAQKDMWARSSPNDYSANSAYGEFLFGTGYAREALPYLERARSLDPLVTTSYVALGMAYDALGEKDRAVASFEEMQARVPGVTDALAIMPQFWRLLAAGDVDRARQLFATNQSAPPQPRAANPVAQTVSRVLEAGRQNLTDPARALAELRGVYADPAANNPVAMANLALFAAHFGDADLAAQAFGRALLADSRWLQFAWTPILEPVRRHAQFKDLMREMKLVDYWRASRWPDHCRPLGTNDFECF